MKRVLCLLLAVGLVAGALAQTNLKIDKSRARKLASWKPQIAKYSKRHYGEDTWQLDPTCIVLHYTVSTGFPWNLVNTNDFAGESPGLAVHYVVDGDKVWEILPPDVRSRGCYGINHRAINIEMVAMEANDLAHRPKTLETAARLCHQLMTEYDIPLEKIYGHQDVATMDTRKVPEALDLVNGAPYDKIDPGAANLKTIKNRLKKGF
ncbi:MAG: peptidoglycan recognition family protein [Vulcanimicrobiota bacterium]